MQGLLLILYILMISSLIAVVGDRVGYRVGKKRLSLFNLRPRHTAIIVAVITGLLISSLTLATLLLLNRSLTNALFNYQNTISTYQIQINTLNQVVQQEQARLSEIQSSLETAQTELTTAREELTVTQTQRSDAQERLRQLQDQVQQLRAQIDQIEQERTEAEELLPELRQDLEEARIGLAQLQSEASEAQAQKQELELDRDRLERSLSIAQASLSGLETQKRDLEAEIRALWQSAQRFRQGPVSILAGEVLAIGVVDGSAITPESPDLDSDEHPLRQQMVAILNQAEEQARQLGAVPPTSLPNAVQVRRDHLDAVLERMARDPQSWAVRVISISNRLAGEPVPVILDAEANERLFAAGEVLASAEIRPGRNAQELQEDLLGLLSTANLQSRQAGLLADPLTGTVGEFSQVRLLEMVERLQQIESPVTVQVVAEGDIYTAGPLVVSFTMPQGSVGSRITTLHASRAPWWR